MAVVYLTANRVMFLVLAFLSGFGHALETESVPLRMCYEEQELEPFFMGKGPVPPESNPGIFIEMLYKLDEQVAEIDLVLQRVPWQRCLNQLALNQSDVVIAGFQEERQKVGVFPLKHNYPDTTLAIAASHYCLFTPNDSALSWDGKKFKNFPQKPVAVPQGYVAVDLLEAQNLPLVKTNSSTAALDLLVKSVAAGAVTDCESGGHFLFKNSDRSLNIIAHSPPLLDRYGYLLFSKGFWQDNPELVQKLWSVSAKIRQQHFQSLLQKYDQLKQ